MPFMGIRESDYLYFYIYDEKNSDFDYNNMQI